MGNVQYIAVGENLYQKFKKKRNGSWKAKKLLKLEIDFI